MHPWKCRTAAVPLLALLAGVIGASGAMAQRGGTETVPENTVVKVRLEQRVSSRDARVGDRVTAVVTDDDRSGFPAQTRVEGRITEVQRAGDDRPGILNMEFNRVVLPGGQAVRIKGQLASLAEEDIRETEDGRIVSRRSGGGDRFDLKWVGYGAGAGAVLATIFGENFLQGALLGGLGGAIYGYLNRDRDRGSFREVTLDEGTTFGVRLNERVTFRDRDDYRYGFRPGRDVERVAGTRQSYRYGTPTVRYNGREIRFKDAQPMLLNGTVYVPLRPVAEEAGMQFTHRRGEDNFVLRTQDGPIRGTVGEVEVRGRRTQGADETTIDSPISINGEVYVPVSFLSRIAELNATWNRQDLRLDLQSNR